jgi:hypothetical protein
MTYSPVVRNKINDIHYHFFEKTYSIILTTSRIYFILSAEIFHGDACTLYWVELSVFLGGKRVAELGSDLWHQERQRLNMEKIRG